MAIDESALVLAACTPSTTALAQTRPNAIDGWSFGRARRCLGPASAARCHLRAVRSTVRAVWEDPTNWRRAHACARTLAPTTTLLLERAHARWTAAQQQPASCQKVACCGAPSAGGSPEEQLRRLLRTVDHAALAQSRALSVRRSLRHAMRSLGLAPVRHSVWSARTPSGAGESATRLMMAVAGSTAFLATIGLLSSSVAALVTGAFATIFNAIRQRIFRSGVSISAGVHMPQFRVGRMASSAGDTAIRGTLGPLRWLAQRLENEIGQVHELEGLARFGALSALVTGSVATLSVVIALATTLGWVQPQREAYDNISHSMQQAGIALTAHHEASLSLRKPHPDTTSQRLLAAFFDGALFYSGPLAEEAAVASAIFLCGRSLLTRTIVAGVLVGGGHWTLSGKKVASTVVRAALTELLRGASPFLPVVFHVAVNYLALDAFVAISPLRGLKLNDNVLTADESTRDLFLELKHFFDPRHGRPFLAMATVLRGSPLRILMPQTRHVIFAQPSKNSGWIWGSPRPPADMLSSQYARVVSETFSLLDTTSSGFLTSQQFAFIFLLQHEPLEVLRGAFDAIDKQLADDERSELMRDIEASRILAWASAKEGGAEREELAHIDAKWSAVANAARQNTQPLQTFVIHPTRRMPDEADLDIAQRHNLPFVCSEWIGAPSSPRAIAARGWLLSSLRAAGGTKIHDPRNHYAANNEPVSSGWARGGMSGLMHDNDDAPLPPLPDEVVPRFRKLMSLFRCYTELLMQAAFQTHLAHYGEVCAPDEPVEREGREDAPPARRFTRASFHAFIRDLALHDAPATDALLTQCVLVLNGSMPHPLAVFNVACASFGQEPAQA